MTESIGKTSYKPTIKKDRNKPSTSNQANSFSWQNIINQHVKTKIESHLEIKRQYKEYYWKRSGRALR